MAKFISTIDKALSALCVTLSVLLVVCVVWQVFSRYVLSQPSTYTDEIARFLFIWVGLIGAAYALGQKKHLAIDLLLTKLDAFPKKQKSLNLFIHIASLSFTVLIMCYGGGKLVLDTMGGGQISPVLGIQMGWVYFAIPLSGLFMLIYLIRDILNDLRF
ncbi:C4-dicarboxylate ABC transporter permease [Chelonobacter oris]|uniref:TRAP transporter small permease protein n=1 Tax=Chelonobacter oris TaxID=505317 RepID=A0A0A3B7H3_9PAST|nr:TRAP transporter small permease [Chelonobacter oris]KGQ69549.1 C4-dicarboxylate ABC transporter permease [Chelonobacter oris]MDH3001646.1 C4-dicarboxylate ABC transporter permease [Chelonobacter oris]